MLRSFTICSSAALALLTCACAQGSPPTADPVQLELALAAIKRQENATAARFQQKIASADRLSSTLSKVAPDKLDPNAAAALLR